MKILFKTIQRPKNELRPDEQADYQSDLLFHGLRSIYGADCVDIPKKDYMYETYPKENTTSLWGRGFTYSRTLPDISIDRTLVPQDCDLVIFSVHHSLQFNHDYQLREFFNLGVSADKVIVVDGHDWPQYNRKLAHIAPHYFKRELDESAPKHIKPVWFAFPKNKIVKEVPEKVRDFARIYPGSNEPHWPKNSRASHVFTDEESYYQEYRESRFAFTCKKGGWDCMRHLEIMCNGCVPIFTDIEDCPERTCRSLEKILLGLVKRMDGLDLPHFSSASPYCYPGYMAAFGQESWTGNNEHWLEVASYLLEHAQAVCHTEYLANNVVKDWRNNES